MLFSANTTKTIFIHEKAFRFTGVTEFLASFKLTFITSCRAFSTSVGVFVDDFISELLGWALLVAFISFD